MLETELSAKSASCKKSAMPNNPGEAWIHNNGYDDAISTTAIGHNAVQQRFPEREREA